MEAVMESSTIKLREDFIKLGQALKAAGLVEMGAEVCLQRGKKLYAGDEVLFGNTQIRIEE